MAETISQTQQVAPIQQTPIAHQPVEVPADFSQRLNSVQPKAEAPKQETNSDYVAPTVEISLDDIKDPVQRTIVQKQLETKLKQANDAISKKFGEIGSEKSKWIQEKQRLESELSQVKNKTFTVQDIAQMVNRPDFVQAAQQYQQQLPPQGSNLAADEWSNLSEGEKSAVATALREAQSAKQQVATMQLSHLHTELKSQYGDYDPTQVEAVITRANSGQMTQKEIFELTYKALRADEMARRAYIMAKEDLMKEVSEKRNGSTMSYGVQTQTSPDALQRNANEPTRSFFKRIAEKNLANLGRK